MSLNDKARAALRRELVKAFPERSPDDAGHDRLAAALSDTAHTPGPWNVAQNIVAGEDTFIYDECADRLAIVRGKDVPHSIASANARLIAAAPELLEALRTVLMRLDLEPVDAVFPCSAMREDIRAAIARAEGGAK